MNMNNIWMNENYRKQLEEMEIDHHNYVLFLQHEHAKELAAMKEDLIQKIDDFLRTKSELFFASLSNIGQGLDALTGIQKEAEDIVNERPQLKSQSELKFETIVDKSCMKSIIGLCGSYDKYAGQIVTNVTTEECPEGVHVVVTIEPLTETFHPLDVDLKPREIVFTEVFKGWTHVEPVTQGA